MFALNWEVELQVSHAHPMTSASMDTIVTETLAILLVTLQDE